VIESIFGGMSRAIIQNSDYQSVDDAKAAVDRYFNERNAHFRDHPRRAGAKVWARTRGRPNFRNSTIVNIRGFVGAVSFEKFDCVPHHRVLIAPVSGSRLWKTGIFAVFAGDFHGFRSQIVEFWGIETEVKSAKASIWRAFSAFSATLSWIE
jgi:hypothetical protein